MTNTVPLSRADLYAHGDCAVDCEGPYPESLVVEVLDVLIVDTLVRSGTVTLAASTRNAGSDAYGQEFDIAPSDARDLGHQLIAAAAECESAD